MELHCPYNKFIAGTDGSILDKLEEEEDSTVELYGSYDILNTGTGGRIFNKLVKNHSERRPLKTRPGDLVMPDPFGNFLV